MKKIVSVILAFCFILALAAVCLANEEKSLVVCGDSIAQGYGIQNPDDASYGKLLADTLGYSYKNFGHDGDRSIDLLEKLNGNKKGIAETDELTVNTEEIDQIEGFSVALKKLFDFFRKLFNIL